MAVHGAIILLSLLIQPLRLLAAEPSCLRIASIAEAPDLNFGGELGEALYREAGLCVSVVQIPTERMKRMIERGELDGVVVRTREFIDAVPELIAVPTPVLQIDGRLYWRAGQAEPKAGSRIGIPRGWIWPRHIVEAIRAEPVEVDVNESLLHMAEAGRIDGFIMAETEFASFVASGRRPGPFSSRSVGILMLHHAVTRVHADLVPALDAAVRRLVERGEVKQLLGLHPSP